MLQNRCKSCQKVQKVAKTGKNLQKATKFPNVNKCCQKLGKSCQKLAKIGKS